MILMNDVYFKIDSNIVEKDFWEVSIGEKKELIDFELKRYLISKIEKVGNSKCISDERELSAEELLGILAKSIPTEEHINTLSNLTHYILQVAGSLQNHSITWCLGDEEELISKPLIEFNENKLWESLKTHKILIVLEYLVLYMILLKITL